MGEALSGVPYSRAPAAGIASTHWRLLLSIAVPQCDRLLSLSLYVSVRQLAFSGMAEPVASPYLMSERCLMGAEYNEFRIRMAENCD